MSFNWQQKGWPNATVNRAALSDELKAFTTAFYAVKETVKGAQDMEVVARTLTDEAVKTSAIEGLRIDESVVMSSIYKALGVPCAPQNFTKDVRAEGVAQMMLRVREEWKTPLSANLLTYFHKALMAGEEKRVTVGAFRSHAEPMRVVRYHADGTAEVRFEAPPSGRMPREIAQFVDKWKVPATNPKEVALRATMLHPHFESIHPFEDGNGRVGRALVAKAIAEGLGLPLILPVSTIIARHRAAYYDEINEASQSLDWTSWAAFFIPVLTEMMNDFVSAVAFIARKRDYLCKYESSFSPRASRVIHRMFEDGEKGAKAGLSAAKWMRMTKVSKPTALADLAELEKVGAVVRVGLGQKLNYQLTDFTVEPLNEPLNGANEPQFEPLNEPLNRKVLELISAMPGVDRKGLIKKLGVSLASVKRAIATLVKAGKVEHRGSKKAGGYFATPLN